MTDLTPRTPQRPLFWPDAVLDLQDMLLDVEQPIYIVGGAVRDAYLHRPVYDVDLATPENAIALGRKIADFYDGDVFVMDRERDVARVFIPLPAMIQGQLVVDVARFRGDDLLIDLQERDFTINALAVDLKRNLNLLIDPLDGEQDLIDKVIRRCADHAVTHDPIRALRAVRQSVQLTARIEPETVKDVRSAAGSLVDTSPERVRDELMKLLTLYRPVAALRVANQLGLLAVILPELVPLHGLEQRPPHVFEGWRHTLEVVERLQTLLLIISPKRTDNTAATFDYGIVVVAFDRFRAELQAHIAQTWPNERSQWGLLILAALLHDIGKPSTAPGFDKFEKASAELAESRLTHLRLSNAEKQRVVTIIRNHTLPLNLPTQLNDLDIHRFWHRLGEAGIDVCLLALADYLGMVGSQVNRDAWLRLVDNIQRLLQAYFTRYEEVVEPPMLVNGDDLMQSLNLKPGPKIKKLLDLIREGQVTKSIRTAEDAIEAARQHLQG